MGEAEASPDQDTGARTMDEPNKPEGRSGGYGSRWKKWLAVYIVVGAVAYLIIYLLFIRGGGGY